MKLAIKSATEETLQLWSIVIGDSNDETNFPLKLLLIDKDQGLQDLQGFCNDSSANIKLPKTGGFLGRLLRPLLKTVLALMTNVLKPSAKSIWIPLGSTASTTSTRIHKTFSD